MPTTMISAYERDQRQPTLQTLVRLVGAAGYELRMHLETADDHDETLATMEAARTPRERERRDPQLDAWRNAAPP